MSKKLFGTCPKGDIYAYTIRNSAGMEATILTYGGALQSLKVPANGGLVDVALGYDNAEDYLNHKLYFGAIVGRNSNRASCEPFTVGGKTVILSDTHGGKQLHGGKEGFSHKLWDAEDLGNALVLTCFSADGEEGFPGNVTTKVTYTVTEDNELRLDYEATPDQDTVINLTNHAYFNLNGGGSVLEHMLWVDSDAYTAQSEQGLSTGELVPVAGTVYDFREPRRIGEGIGDPAEGKLRFYDLNYCLKGEGLRKVAVLKGDFLTMETETTTPGVQLYAAGFSKPHPAKVEGGYNGYCFACLETQGWPDSMHVEGFPSDIVKAGETYRQTTIYRFY